MERTTHAYNHCPRCGSGQVDAEFAYTMTSRDRVSKMPPWTMARFSREVYDALRKMGLGESTVDKLHYTLMGGRLKDAARFIDIKPYLD